jgi:hypothetical protein
MLIDSLTDVEKIVDNNDSLSWDGWTVIETKSSPTAWMSPQGAYQDGKWVIRKRYEWNNGWNIPRKFVKNEQQG